MSEHVGYTIESTDDEPVDWHPLGEVQDLKTFSIRPPYLDEAEVEWQGRFPLGPDGSLSLQTAMLALTVLARSLCDFLSEENARYLVKHFRLVWKDD